MHACRNTVSMESDTEIVAEQSEMDKSNLQKDLATTSIVCTSCNKEFSSKGNRNRHYKKVHAALDTVEDNGGSGTIHCLEQDCEFRCRYISGLRKHLVSIHGFKMDEEEVTFQSLEGDLAS